MQVKNPLLDDIARLASGALGAASGLREEVETLVKERVQRLLDNMDLVNREEFEAVRAMAAKAREEQEQLAVRVAALEAKAAPQAKRAPSKRKPVAAKARKSAGRSGPTERKS